MAWRLGSATVALVGLLASCSAEGQGAAPSGSPEADADTTTSTPGADVRTRTDVVLSLPAEAGSEEREAVARTLQVRAQAVASGASVDVDGDRVLVALSGLAGAAAGDALIDESLLAVGEGLETRASDDPDWLGCDSSEAEVEDDVEEPAWRCEDGGEVAHLVEVGWSMERPARVEVDEATVNVDLVATDAVRFGHLTADLACEHDAGGSATIAVLAGSRVLLAAGVSPEVACGEGVRDGAVAIALGPDRGAAEAERLAEALRSSFEVTPELQSVSVVTEERAP